MIECRDGSVYTGIAIDVARRYAQHVAGTGARYTRAHPPLRPLGHCAYPDRATASRAEYLVKRLSPAQKRALCAAWMDPSSCGGTDQAHNADGQTGQPVIA